jgi:hypothetical protein
VCNLTIQFLSRSATLLWRRVMRECSRAPTSVSAEARSESPQRCCCPCLLSCHHPCVRHQQRLSDTSVTPGDGGRGDRLRLVIGRRPARENVPTPGYIHDDNQLCVPGTTTREPSLASRTFAAGATLISYRSRFPRIDTPGCRSGPDVLTSTAPVRLLRGFSVPDPFREYCVARREPSTVPA